MTVSWVNDWETTSGKRERVSHVRQCSCQKTPVTESADLAGLTGQVYGVTTPSVTAVDVTSESTDDEAIHVNFEDRQEGF